MFHGDIDLRYIRPLFPMSHILNSLATVQPHGFTALDSRECKPRCVPYAPPDTSLNCARCGARFHHRLRRHIGPGHSFLRYERVRRRCLASTCEHGINRLRDRMRARRRFHDGSLLRSDLSHCRCGALCALCRSCGEPHRHLHKQVWLRYCESLRIFWV